MSEPVENKKSRYARPFSLHLSAEDATPVPKEEREQFVQMRESITYWKDAARRFRKNKVAMISLFVIIAVFLFAFVGPFFSPYTYDQQIRGHERQFPSAVHPMGTDNLGRDMLTRIMVGTQISLLIGVVCALIVLVVGTVYGSVSGYFGGWVDNIMMRFAEIIYSIPDILLIILFQIAFKEPLNKMFPNSKLGSSVISIFLAFALIYWVSMARMVRGQVMQIKGNEYVTAAIAMGVKNPTIIRRHLVPNSIGTIIVTTLFQIPSAIFTEAFLSFMGLGPSAPMTSLGSLASDSLNGMQSYPYLMLGPALMLCIIILAFNQFGDGLRDALDPRLRK